MAYWFICADKQPQQVYLETTYPPGECPLVSMEIAKMIIMFYSASTKYFIPRLTSQFYINFSSRIHVKLYRELKQHIHIISWRRTFNSAQDDPLTKYLGIYTFHRFVYSGHIDNTILSSKTGFTTMKLDHNYFKPSVTMTTQSDDITNLSATEADQLYFLHSRHCYCKEECFL